MSVDGQDGTEMGVATGLPQGSPISPAFFVIYIAEIHLAGIRTQHACAPELPAFATLRELTSLL